MVTEKRLIDANDLKWKISQVALYVQGLRFGKTLIGKILESYRRSVFEEIDNAYTVDAVEVAHGKWIEDSCDFLAYYECNCSRCGGNGEKWYNYCPNCGAKMDGDGNG